MSNPEKSLYTSLPTMFSMNACVLFVSCHYIETTRTTQVNLNGTISYVQFKTIVILICCVP